MTPVDPNVVHVPIWMIAIVWAVLLGLILYVWKSLESRVKDLEGSEEDNLKKQAEAGIVLTIPVHETICGKVHEQFEKTLVEKLSQLEKNFDLKVIHMQENVALVVENAILKAFKEEAFRGVQGIQGIQGANGVQGKRGKQGLKGGSK
jgi:hypothetical protein